MFRYVFPSIAYGIIGRGEGVLWQEPHDTLTVDGMDMDMDTENIVNQDGLTVTFLDREGKGGEGV